MTTIDDLLTVVFVVWQEDVDEIAVVGIRLR